MNNVNKLEWKDEFSVGVKEIDDQHKKLFGIINELIVLVGEVSKKKKLGKIIKSLVEYKKSHFETEEKYFKEFNYEGAAEHIKEHQGFNTKLEEIVEENQDSDAAMAYALVDFLEDWLIDHLINEDQKYKKCFLEHGLK